MKPSYLAIVTARSGSKRLPNKNILDLAGKPLMVWSIDAAFDCPAIERVVVSTDSEEYRQISIAAGADCPWLRPAALSADSTSSADVVSHVLDMLGSDIERYAGLVLLQPTSPMRTAEDILGAISLFEERNPPAVVSVSAAECPPAWMGQLPSDMALDAFTPEAMRTMVNSNDNPWMRLNGAVYVISIAAFRKEHGFLPSGTLGYVMPRERSIDVDTAFDFTVAECLLRNNGS